MHLFNFANKLQIQQQQQQKYLQMIYSMHECLLWMAEIHKYLLENKYKKVEINERSKVQNDNASMKT